ncbi:MAG: hypothetical protein ABWX74_04870, partial [Aeromicrobium sp.]
MLHTVDRDPSASASRALRVASVPSSHVYVRHLSPDVDDVLPAVERLADPPPTDGPAEQSRWWPPAMLEAGWVADHAEEFDVLHLHFGFDARTPRELQDVVDALRAAGRPL